MTARTRATTRRKPAKPPELGTLFDLLADRGSPTTVHLSRPFDICPDGGVTFGVERLARLVREAAGWLAAAGTRPGDRVAVVKANHWDVVLLACAAARMGAVPALISDDLPATALQTLLERLEPTLLITDSRTVEALTAAGTEPAVFVPRTLTLDRKTAGTLGLDDVRGHQPPPVLRRHPDDTLVVHHTSGTTGVPKLVAHTTRTIIHRLAHFECHRTPVVAARRDDTVAGADPFVHGRAVPWTTSVFHLAPRKVVILADTDPAVVARTLAAHPPTTVEASPATYVRWQGLAAGPGNPFRAVRLYISTFDSVHPPTVRGYLNASRRRHPVWLQGWGQTETGPLTFRLLTRKALAATGRRHPTTRNLGRPVPGRTRLRVVDPDTFRPVGRGRPGIILARTKARCTGYVGEQDRWSRKALGPWWNTGDIGFLTRTGSLVLLDREVDAVPGTSCVELEDVIEDRLPAVLECTVLGAPGRTLLPVVVTADGWLDAAAWRAAVRDLPPLAEPMVRSWAEIPRTGTGKVRRLELRAQLLPDATTFGTGDWT